MRGGRFAHLNLTVNSGDGLNQSGEINLRFRLQRATNPLQIRWELQKNFQKCFGSDRSTVRSEKFRIPARKVLCRTEFRIAGKSLCLSVRQVVFFVSDRSKGMLEA
ncbi:unnamed protein product [Victoria cruziana]